MRRLAFLAVLALALPATAEAQTRLMLGGGLSSPNGDFSDAVDSGLHGRVGIQVGVPVFPVSFRGEAELHRFSEASGGGGNTNVLDGTISAVVSLGGIGLSPYVIGGIGSYRIDDSSSAEAVTSRGIHGGFGVSIGALGLGGFAEVRFVKIDDAADTKYIPITLGFRF